MSEIQASPRRSTADINVNGLWLHEAVNAHNLELIQIKAKQLGAQMLRGLIISSRNHRNGELAVHSAARLGYGDILELLISSDVQNLISATSTGEHRWTCLHFAAAHGHADIVSWLCKLFPDQADLIKKRDEEGNTALHLAASAGYKDVVRHLVHTPSDLFTENETGEMPVSFCKDHPFLFEALVKATSFDTPDDIDPPPLQFTDKKGRSILFHAAQFAKDPDVIVELCNAHRGAALCHRDKDEETFLQVAAIFGNRHILQALKRLDNDGVARLFEVSGKRPIRSPGMYALLHSRSEFFHELISVGNIRITLGCITKALIKELVADPSINHRLGVFVPTLPTYLALYAGKDCIFDFLVQTDLFSPNDQDDEYKRTCLHWAVLDGRVDIVEKLCCDDKLQNPIRDRDGLTALQHAFQKKNGRVMEILRGTLGFREHEDKLFKDRDVYVQVLNAILVGAALIASVTFVGWLQVPNGQRFESTAMRVFWVCNSFSFFCAVASMCLTTTTLLPTPDKYIGDIVNQLQVNIVTDASFFAVALAAATMAFAAAGFSASPDQSQYGFTYLRLMAIPTFLGGLLCILMFREFILQLKRCTPSQGLFFTHFLSSSRFLGWLLSAVKATAAVKLIRGAISYAFGTYHACIALVAPPNHTNIMYIDLVDKLKVALTKHAEGNRELLSEDSLRMQFKHCQIPDFERFIVNLYKEKQILGSPATQTIVDLGHESFP